MLKFNHRVFQIVHVAESGGMQTISNGQQYSDLPSLHHRIGFIQRPSFKIIRTLYRGIDVSICHHRTCPDRARACTTRKPAGACCRRLAAPSRVPRSSGCKRGGLRLPAGRQSGSQLVQRANAAAHLKPHDYQRTMRQPACDRKDPPGTCTVQLRPNIVQSQIHHKTTRATCITVSCLFQPFKTAMCAHQCTHSANEQYVRQQENPLIS